MSKLYPLALVALVSATFALTAIAQTNGFTANFNNYSDGTKYTSTQCAADMGPTEYWLDANNTTVKGGALRLTMRKNQSCGNGGITAEPRMIGDKVYSLEYRVKFDKNFKWIMGGKLPGLAGGSAPSGGSWDGSDGKGFSTRYMWREKGAAELYVYYRDQTKEYGDSWLLGESFVVDRWYTLKQRVTVNSGSNYDGRVEVWIDGCKVLDRGGLRLMTQGNIVDKLRFDSFMGGCGDEWEASADQYIYIDDIACVKNGGGGDVCGGDVADALSVSAPGKVTVGQSATVNVDYGAAGARDIVVAFKSDDGKVTYTSKKVDVPAGSGSKAITLTIPTSVAPKTDGYEWLVYLTTDGGGWGGRKKTYLKNAVDAAAAASTSYIRIYGDAMENEWANWSWGGSANLSDGLAHKGSKAFKFNYDNGGVVSFRHPGGFDADGLQHIEFFARTWSGTTNLEVSGSYDDNFSNAAAPKTITVDGTYKLFKITRAELGNYGWYKRFFIKRPGGSGSVFFDRVQLIYADGSAALAGRSDVDDHPGGLLAEPVGGAAMAVYPNPADAGNRLLVDLSSSADAAAAVAELTDLTGRVVASVPLAVAAGRQTYALDLTLGSRPAAGLYVLRIRGLATADGTPTAKVRLE